MEEQPPKTTNVEHAQSAKYAQFSEANKGFR